MRSLRIVLFALAFAALVHVAPHTAHADPIVPDTYWIGPNQASWYDSANWWPFGPPDVFTTAVIDNFTYARVDGPSPVDNRWPAWAGTVSVGFSPGRAGGLIVDWNQDPSSSTYGQFGALVVNDLVSIGTGPNSLGVVYVNGVGWRLDSQGWRLNPSLLQVGYYVGSDGRLEVGGRDAAY